MNRQLPALLAVALLAAAAGYFAAMHFAQEATEEPGGGSIVGQHRPDFSHLDTSGRTVSAGDFDGTVMLVNFWATWCEPCVEEMPMLSGLRQALAERGFEVVGIALDEPERAEAFAADLGLVYPVLLGEADTVVTGRRYGNDTGMLPYSVLVDRQGVVRWSKLGALERAELEREIKRLLGAD